MTWYAAEVIEKTNVSLQIQKDGVGLKGSNLQAPVVQTLDSAIHWLNHYPLDNSIGFTSVYPLDSDLSGGQRYPSFEQLGQVIVPYETTRRKVDSMSISNGNLFISHSQGIINIDLETCQSRLSLIHIWRCRRS